VATNKSTIFKQPKLMHLSKRSKIQVIKNVCDIKKIKNRQRKIPKSFVDTNLKRETHIANVKSTACSLNALLSEWRANWLCGREVSPRWRDDQITVVLL